jgi:hypothetical protein
LWMDVIMSHLLESFCDLHFPVMHCPDFLCQLITLP